MLSHRIIYLNMQMIGVRHRRIHDIPKEDEKVDLLKGGFTHSCFIAFVHHGCQENLT